MGSEPKRSSPVVRSEVSPTGAPIIPVRFVPVLGAICATAVAVEAYAPPDHWSAKVAHVALGLCAFFGIFSPGARSR